MPAAATYDFIDSYLLNSYLTQPSAPFSPTCQYHILLQLSAAPSLIMSIKLANTLCIVTVATHSYLSRG